MGNIKFTLFAQIFAYIILTCTNPYMKDECTFGKYFDKRHNIDKALNTRAERLLANYELRYASKKADSTDFLTRCETFRTLRNQEDDIPEYVKLYKYRKGSFKPYKEHSNLLCAVYKDMKKVDSCFEKNIFNHLERLDELKKHKRTPKRTCKRRIFRKYDIFLFIGYIIPLLVVMFSLLNYVAKQFKYTEYVGGSTMKNLNGNFYFIPIILIPIIYFLTFSYVHQKVNKFRRLKYKYRMI
ncbi:variable surface protein [Plasmodium gonderi]|uniref:Variable surface protein n=1 Tax=Plasmodium gonderi TaxID=77519 RepID=A0A1Y1JPH5_PLAGO|nr:variable surface protein [Plasmodium gonderi]GAW84349.1 variable surface protein [Plasmodium gonderi]